MKCSNIGKTYKDNLESLIQEIVNKYSEKILFPKKTCITEYEKAFGIDEKTKRFSRNFSNHLGKIFQEVFNLSKYYEKLSCDGYFGGADGIIKDENTLIEVKCSYNTMKASTANHEIGRKLT